MTTSKTAEREIRELRLPTPIFPTRKSLALPRMPIRATAEMSFCPTVRWLPRPTVFSQQRKRKAVHIQPIKVSLNERPLSYRSELTQRMLKSCYNCLSMCETVTFILNFDNIIGTVLGIFFRNKNKRAVWRCLNFF